MDMAQMNVSIPDALKSWAENRVAEGRYSSTSDYVRDLIRRDQERADELAALETALDAGEKSGISTRTIDDVIADHQKRRRARG